MSRETELIVKTDKWVREDGVPEPPAATGRAAVNREARSHRGSQAPAFTSPFALKCNQDLSRVWG